SRSYTGVSVSSRIKIGKHSGPEETALAPFQSQPAGSTGRAGETSGRTRDRSQFHLHRVIAAGRRGFGGTVAAMDERLQFSVFSSSARSLEAAATAANIHFELRFCGYAGQVGGGTHCRER